MQNEQERLQLQLCISLAHYAHMGQVDKAGKRYIDHPLRVMERVSHAHEKMAAVLHDVLEDTWVQATTLYSLNLPLAVVNAVVALSRFNLSNKEYMYRLKADAIAWRVKIADLTDNLDSQRMTAWSALGIKEAKAASQYARIARKQLEELCRYAGREVPNV